jgi:hypothetical protein
MLRTGRCGFLLPSALDPAGVTPDHPVVHGSVENGLEQSVRLRRRDVTHSGDEQLVAPVPHACLFDFSDRLQGRTSGAPRLRPEPATRAGAGTEGRSGRETGDERQGSPGPRRCGAAAFAAPFGPKPYGATSCRARLSRHRPQPVPRRNAPMSHHTSRTCRRAHARCADRRMKTTATRAGTPRIVRDGPSSVKGTPRSFLTASQKGSSGSALERRSLCQPQRAGRQGPGQRAGPHGARRTSQFAPCSAACTGRWSRSTDEPGSANRLALTAN